MNPLIFREYDIRGNAERDLPDDLVRAIGQAIVPSGRRLRRRRTGNLAARSSLAVTAGCTHHAFMQRSSTVSAFSRTSRTSASSRRLSRTSPSST